MARLWSQGRAATRYWPTTLSAVMYVPAQIAEAIGDRLMLCFALGYQGEIAEVQKRDAEAMALTRRALFLAQEAQSPHAMYRWQWQIGRLLRDQGQITDAIDAYDNALRNPPWHSRRSRQWFR